MGWEQRNDSWVVQRRRWDGGVEKRLQQAEKAQCLRGGTGWSGVLLPPPASTIPMPPALQEHRSQSTASSHLCEMVQGDFSLPESTMSCLLQKGELTPQAQAPGQNTKQNCPSSLWWKQNHPQAGAHKQIPNLYVLQKQEGNRSPFPTTPMRNTGGHNPACHHHYPALLNKCPLRAGRHLHPGWLARGVGHSLPQNRIWFPWGAGAPLAQGGADFRSSSGHQCSELGRPQPGPGLCTTLPVFI